MIGHIRVIHVGPEAHLFGEILPHALVLPHAFLTFLNERGDSVFFDLLLAVQPKKLLHFQFHRKAMGIPSCFSGNHISLHGPISGDHILNSTRLHMADMRLSVRGRRSIIEGISRAAFPDLHALLKDMVFFPEFLNVFFPLHKIEVGVHFFVKRHFLHPFRFLSVIFPAMPSWRNILIRRKMNFPIE